MASHTAPDNRSEDPTDGHGTQPPDVNPNNVGKDPHPEEFFWGRGLGTYAEDMGNPSENTDDPALLDPPRYGDISDPAYITDDDNSAPDRSYNDPALAQPIAGPGRHARGSIELRTPQWMGILLIAGLAIVGISVASIYAVHRANSRPERTSTAVLTQQNTVTATTTPPTVTATHTVTENNTSTQTETSTKTVTHTARPTSTDTATETKTVTEKPDPATTTVTKTASPQPSTTTVTSTVTKNNGTPSSP